MDLPRRHLRADRIPPVPAICAAIALGIAVPFLLPAKYRPPEFTEAFARNRLERFQGVSRSLAPRGEIHAERPAFYWEEAPGAAAYDFRLSIEGGTDWISSLRVPRPPLLLPAPGRVETGKRYRFTIQPLDAAGAPLGERIGAEFQRVEPPPEIATMLANARRFARGAELAFLLAGIYAEAGSSDDVASALAAYLQAAPDGPHAPLAAEVLARLGRTRVKP
jgi:hypothetical protein